MPRRAGADNFWLFKIRFAAARRMEKAKNCQRDFEMLGLVVALVCTASLNDIIISETTVKIIQLLFRSSNIVFLILILRPYLFNLEYIITYFS